MKKLKHIISVSQFLDKNLLEDLFALTSSLEAKDAQKKLPKKLQNLVFATLFYEPSTRTRLSFEVAIQKLGGLVVSTENASNFSSAIKGETLEDSIKIVGNYADSIILRHSHNGAAELAAKVSSVPIINAGDGTGEHPTQALLDIYTIKKELGRLTGLKVALVGDLLNGRTVHSLIPLLSLYKNRLYLVSPKNLKLPQSMKEDLRKKGIDFAESEKLNMLNEIDVLYLTRVQKERFKGEKEYLKVKDSFVIDNKVLKDLSKKAIIMHPLPRVNEISKEVDNDKRAAYFRQAKNGLYIRMALLSGMLHYKS
jgi:aspartate carbamoyltransferase catalytic subunit